MSYLFICFLTSFVPNFPLKKLLPSHFLLLHFTTINDGGNNDDVGDITNATNFKIALIYFDFYST